MLRALGMGWCDLTWKKRDGHMFRWTCITSLVQQKQSKSDPILTAFWKGKANAQQSHHNFWGWFCWNSTKKLMGWISWSDAKPRIELGNVLASSNKTKEIAKYNKVNRFKLFCCRRKLWGFSKMGGKSKESAWHLIIFQQILINFPFETKVRCLRVGM